jgi:predicted nucleotidyltransferase
VQLIETLRGRLAALAAELPIERAVLFGSWAAGRATAFSDIDVLVVYAGPTRDDTYSLVWRALHLRGLELHLYAETEAERLQPTLARMTRDGIDLLT